MKTKTIEILCDKHTHAGRDYPRGAIIQHMDADSADWLISLARAKETDNKSKPLKKESQA
jgi:hypothetical protein